MSYGYKCSETKKYRNSTHYSSLVQSWLSILSYPWVWRVQVTRIKIDWLIDWTVFLLAHWLLPRRPLAPTQGKRIGWKEFYSLPFQPHQTTFIGHRYATIALQSKIWNKKCLMVLVLPRVIVKIKTDTHKLQPLQWIPIITMSHTEPYITEFVRHLDAFHIWKALYTLFTNDR